jgi:hypothetical protein
MLSDKSYAKFFGEGLLEEIFHLDEELTQAIANKQDPSVEEELERSLEVALSEAEVEGTNILNEAKKSKPKFHVYSAFGGSLLSSHHSESAAHKAAAEHSHKQPVHVWTAEGGEMGMGKPIAHYNKGEKTVYEDFERGIDAMIEAEIGTMPNKRKGKTKGPSCPDCGAHVKHLSIRPYDFGRDSDTGYHDAGERYHCSKCGGSGDASDVQEAATLAKPKRKISDARRSRFHQFLKDRSYCSTCQEHGHSTKDCNASCPTCHGGGRFSKRGCNTCGNYMEPDE